MFRFAGAAAIIVILFQTLTAKGWTKSTLKPVLKEIIWWKERHGRDLHLGSKSADTIYFGGGTPSILKPDFFIRVIEACRSTFQLSSDAEITIEANPDSLNQRHLRELRQAGVNRVSLGIQSFDDSVLKAMGRIHTGSDAIKAMKTLAAANFGSVSVDLIVGYPGQTVSSLREGLKQVLDLLPDHMAVYSLELKPETELYRRIESGESPPINERLILEFYDQAFSQIAEAGYQRYEMSTFAREGCRCRHNLKYWTDGLFWGFGSGAQGMTGIRRYVNNSDLRVYFDAVNTGRAPFSSLKKISAQTRFKRALVMGSYLMDGADLTWLSKRYQVDASAFVLRTLGECVEDKLIDISNGSFKLTPKGRAQARRIFSSWSH